MSVLAEKTGMRRIAADQERVQRATRKDNAYLQYLGRSTAKWETPADQYMAHRTGRSSKVGRERACHRVQDMYWGTGMHVFSTCC